ncbi:unnamed protein product [Caenorhabditis angaria]|uniref:Uncharacterized protein n=1 Tax=Caenorhabditis angaria TaxID=860376 RepID=A0A9P1IP86_9PELO|nr:unnamed protein product [Caenorhabditis angaria]
MRQSVLSPREATTQFWRNFVALLLVAPLCIKTQVLTPSQITISHRKPIQATSTCGEINGQSVNEVYCSLTGSSQYTPLSSYSYKEDEQYDSMQELRNQREAFVQGGHGCGHCMAHSQNSHPASNMVDGNNSWWMSPPLSRGLQYNEVNITIDLEQEFHVAYVWIQMANSPRPGSWVLERSTDHGKTFSPWFNFAENSAECMRRFGMESLSPISDDDSVICRTDMASLQPLENAEMVIRILEHRPGSLKFATSEGLQNFTRATNVRIRLLGTRTLQGHHMETAQLKDPTVTRRYFYAIKEIMIGGRCVCNGHAVTCDILDINRPRSLLCRCEHNTFGDMCEKCLPGFEQKKWQPTTAHNNFTCEPCNCFGRSNQCEYDEELDINKQSLDIHGNYEGGGRCLNCQYNTEGINCNKCSYGYYRPEAADWNDLSPCSPCDCDPAKHTGACAEGTGKCECQARFEGENCDRCAKGYYDPPECRLCDCNVNGTLGEVCLPENGQCPCKPGFGGKFCDTCDSGFTNVTAGCVECVCDEKGSENSNCSASTGQCECKPEYAGLSCDKCQTGYFGESCTFCNCDPDGTEGGICDQNSGQCLCKPGFSGEKCEKCDTAFYGYPNCKPCDCDGAGKTSLECDATSGQCPCNGNFTGRQCETCTAGFYGYPECRACECLLSGAKGQTCDNNGQCYCKGNFEGERCDRCKPNLYNFPICEECNCNPNGVTRDFQGCDKVSPGELCSCRKNVDGRICDSCKPTFWDLKYQHEDGCISCGCNTNGTISGLNTCDLKSGQCLCKKNAGGRTCDQCAEGFYQLNAYNQLGCEPCHCDVGGSIRPDCDIKTGQCKCRPRITGLRCDRPIENHYFPTLWHNQYEAEDAHTEDQRPVRFAVDESQFKNYSWRGYAVFSPIQERILMDVDINKASIYKLIFRYVNPTDVPINAVVSIAPRSSQSQDVEQSTKATFAAGSKDPAFKVVEVGKNQGFVLNPGKWTLSISTKQRLFLDYIVVLPIDYYDGQILKQRAPQPCVVNNPSNVTCIDSIYPPLPKADRIFADTENMPFNYVNEDGSTTPLELVPIEILPHKVTGPAAFVRTDNSSRVIEGKVNVPEDGEYVVIIEYHNREKDNQRVGVEVLQNGELAINGSAIIHNCPYTTFCREIVSANDQIAAIPLKQGEATIHLIVNPNHEFGLAAITILKKSDFNNDHLHQVPVCIRHGPERCDAITYPPAANTAPIEAEIGANEAKALSGDKLSFPVAGSSDISVVLLEDKEGNIEISGAVPSRGHYMFIINYFNPDNAPINIDALIQNEHFQQATVPLAFCPSSGCRALVYDKERPDLNHFFIESNFTITFYPNATQKGPIFIDSIIAVPYNVFNQKLMEPVPLDMSERFKKECNKEYFRNHPEEVSDYCKEKIFALTTDFNSAALSCDCVAQGSESFQCEEYGGQCQCKANIIGRRCERCAPGYYNFPECIKCSCNSGQQCDERTGQCFCPQHVDGLNCEKCVSNAFGYDPLIGCQKCGCHPQGSEGGRLECDAESGQCLCRESMGGRQCDRCLAGFYGFPQCYGCTCNRAGTTDQICDATNAQCTCKENVYGGRCEACKAGTFDLSAENPLGCVNCYCFGVTDSCRSSMFPVSILPVDMSAFLTTDDSGMVDNKDDTVVYTSEEGSPDSVYFVVPIDTSKDYTTSYGLGISFTLQNTPRGDKKRINSDADVRISGANKTVECWSSEAPTNPEETFTVKCVLAAENFMNLEGKPVTREDLMKILHSLQNITIKASYFNNPKTSTLHEFGLEVSNPNGEASVIKASSVEQCQCPAPYTGPSCQLCASGYYRIQSAGNFLGACVPCECNGHSGTCDPNTGICTDCEHNTHGDHCEFCDEGHHGNATNGSPYDCMPCACPFAPTNNFATACDVSEEGQTLQCYCKPGYTGERCDRCAAGFFGQPGVPGGSCEPCQCNNNNNLTDSRSCHPVSGDCYLCENNTDGRHCEWCAQWYHGDAIGARNCSSCSCDQCGSQVCDNRNGGCACKPNVEGDECDRCAPDHWGFSKCRGCERCNCGTAAFNSQCDGENGQCTCRPGAAGSKCEHCEHGYWNYGEHGCEKCDCESDLSLGTVCDVRTGQCQCQEGATGPRCDQCHPSYLRIPTMGCRRCDECVHHLIGDVDNLELEIEILGTSIGNISSATIVGARLARSKKELADIGEVEKLLNDEESMFGNVFGDAAEVLTNATQVVHKVDRIGSLANIQSQKSHNLTTDGDAIFRDVITKSERARQSVRNLLDIARSIGSSSSAVNVDTKLIEEAQSTLNELESASATPQSEKVESVPKKIAEINEKISGESDRLKMLGEKVESEKNKTEQLAGYLNSAQQKLKKTEAELRKSETASKVAQVNKITNMVAAINADMKKVDTLNNDLNNTQLSIQNLTESNNELREQLNLETANLNETRTEISEAMEATRRAKREDEEGYRQELIQKAGELRGKSAGLRDQFDSDRVERERAFAATNAYSDLSQTLKNATNEAEAAIEVVKKEGEGLEDLKTSLKNTVEETGKTLKIKDELKVANLLKDVEKVQRENDELDEYVRDLQRRRDNLNLAKNENSELFETISEKTKEVEKVLENVGEDQDQEKIASLKNEAQKVSDRRAEAIEGIVIARSNVGELKQVTPGLVAAIAVLKSNTQEKTAKFDAVAEKVSQIREKIAVARDAANRIKLGAHFERGSSLNLKVPQRVTRSAAHTDVSFYIRTEQEHGIPLFFGNEENVVGSRAVPTDDFIAVELEYGRPKVTVDLGDAPIVVKLDTPINDNQWRRIHVERIGKTVNVTISKPNSEELAETKNAVAVGNKSVLNLHQDISKLYVGGIPRGAQISRDIYNREFVGDIEQLKLHGEPVGLWNSNDNGATNVQGALKRPKFADSADEMSISLGGEGYTSYKPNHWNPRKVTKITLSFLTFSPEGLLFFVGKDRDFMSLELSEGAVKLSTDLGSGVGQWTSETSNYNDGKWHTVSIVREEKHVKMQIDGESSSSLEGDVPGKDTEMSVTEFLYIGGIPSGINVRTTVVPLRGCIKSVRLGSDEVDLENSHASKGARSGCPINTVRTVSLLSERTLASFANITKSGEDVSVTFKFKTKAINNPSTIFAINDDEDAVLSMTIDSNGILTAKSGEDSATLELAASPDEKWHYVSVRKSKSSIRIDADDSFSNEVSRKHQDESNTEVLLSAEFGKATEDASSFVGCIGDVTLNGKLLDFAQATIKEVALNGCSLREDEFISKASTTTTTTTESPEDRRVLPQDLEEEENNAEVTTTPEPTEPPTEPPAEPIPEGSCGLPLNPAKEIFDADGHHFGTELHSRIEYAALPDAIDKSSEFTFKIRPTALNGLVFIATNGRTDHISVYLENGRVMFSFDSGANKNSRVLIASDSSILDGRWHSIKVSRRGNSAHLIVDDSSFEPNTTIATHNDDLIETVPPFFLGGLPTDILIFAKGLSQNMREQFSGCIRDFRLNGKILTGGNEIGVAQCSEYQERGLYFGKDGGYAIVDKNFNVGAVFEIEFDIRPRSKNGLILSVGNSDFINLELQDGNITLTAKTADTKYSTQFVVPNSNFLCDGQWSRILIKKRNKLINLSVNNKMNLAVLKKGNVMNTNAPLYIGGVPKGAQNDGVKSTEPFVGCMRIVRIGEKPKDKKIRRKKDLDFMRFEIEGDVSKSGCPII